MGLRNTAYGFFQAILITDYTSMISLIIIIRISIFISFIYFRKCYKFKSELVLKLSYVGFGIFYDLILGITYLNF
jgi:ABC-type phosphate transport system permease subunit